MSDIVTRLKEATEQLLQPGSPYELGTAVVNGAELPGLCQCPGHRARGAGRGPRTRRRHLCRL